MVLNVADDLPEAVPPTVLVIRMAKSVLVKNHARAFCRIFGAVQIPVVAGISALNRHIRVIRHSNVEIYRIYPLKLFTVKHVHLLIFSS